MKAAGGTGGKISARMHAANSLGDRAKEGRRSIRRHSANSLWERVESCVASVASIVVAYASIRSDWGERSACTHASHSSWERVDSCANGSSLVHDIDADDIPQIIIGVHGVWTQ